MKIADEIVDNPDVSKWYGTFTIGDHGVFTINRAKAKMLLEIAVDTLKKSSDMRVRIARTTNFEMVICRTG